MSDPSPTAAAPVKAKGVAKQLIGEMALPSAAGGTATAGDPAPSSAGTTPPRSPMPITLSVRKALWEDDNGSGGVMSETGGSVGSSTSGASSFQTPRGRRAHSGSVASPFSPAARQAISARLPPTVPVFEDDR